MTSAQFSARRSAHPRNPSPHPAPAGVAHVRHRHDTHFTVVGNHLAQHDTLSLTAVGLAVHIQSLPDGARVGIKALAARFPESEYRIAGALKELEAAGYLERTKVRTAGQRIITRTRYFECPASRVSEHQQVHPQPVDEPVRPAERPPRRPPAPPPERSPATDLLSGLRRADARLTLSVREITQLAPAASAWLALDVPPQQVIRTLTADLPDGIIRRPAALLAHRLTHRLPPALPTPPAPPPPPPRPDPFQECPGCDRVFRSPTPGRCRDCR